MSFKSKILGHFHALQQGTALQDDATHFIGDVLAPLLDALVHTVFNH